MGGTSKQTQQTQSTSQPWDKAQPALQDILGGLKGINPNLTGTETGALDTLTANARAGNPYAGQIGNLASDLLGGGPDRTGMVSGVYDRFQSQLAPTAAGDYLDPNKNPWFSQVTQTIGNDVQNRLSGMYAGAGRDPAGAGNFAQGLGRGVAEGVAPIFANAYNMERGNQLGAIRDLFGGGGQTAGLMSGLDQTALGNRQAGVGAAGAALNAQNYGPNQLLAIEAQRRGIPLQLLQQMAGIATPIAGLGGQTSGTTTTTTPSNPLQALLGAGIAGVGLMSGNPFAAMSGLGGASGAYLGGSPLTNPLLNPATYGNIR